MRRIAQLSLIAPLSLLIALSGCENGSSVTSPQDQVTAQYAAKKPTGPRRVLAVVTSGHGEADVGANGGTIVVQGAGPTDIIAMLVVPAGTVKKNTTFTVDVAPDYTIELTATADRSTNINDVGRAGFKKGILLYFNRSNIFETGILGVAELKQNGQLLPVQSTDNGLWIIGTLKHFSSYVPISD
jgi:hypothetical protein